jgi:hypothetical protein
MRGSLRALVLYEDLPAGLRAVWFCSALRSALNCQVQKDLWNFEVLQILKYRKLSALAARKAHILIVSVSAQKDLPIAVQSWLETLLARSGQRKPALVALFGSTPQQKTASVYLLLSRVARHGGTYFFPHSASTPGDKNSVPSVKTMKLIAEEFRGKLQFDSEPASEMQKVLENPFVPEKPGIGTS